MKPNSSIQKADGYIYIEQKSPEIKIRLLGDYLFQPLKTKYFRDVDQRFIKYITVKYNNQVPKILYKAHTSFTDINNELKDRLNSTISEMKRIQCGGKEVFKIKYQTTNSINKIYSSHAEYFFQQGNYVYRILFWTTEENDNAISYEVEKIIANIRF